MTAATAADLSLIVIRIGLGIVFIAHGWNHILGEGRIAGTARWFESIGMRPGIMHAWLASITELGAGGLLLLGLATPVACAGVVGTMFVALVTNHLKNGFFVFRPGEGYEYVLILILMAVGLAGVGAGNWSLDSALNWFQPGDWWGLVVAVVAGGGGAIGQMLLFWRPTRPVVQDQ